MKATFKGYINVEKNAVFVTENKYKGIAISETHHELKDDINSDNYVIGEEYEIDGIVK